METVKIVSKDFEGGFVVINKEDYDEAAMTLYIEPKSKATEPAEEIDEAIEMMRRPKSELIALAEEKGITVVADEVTKSQIVDLILAGG